MVRHRLAVALSTAAAVILSAPFIQQAFTAASSTWGAHFRAVGMAVSVLPVSIALLVAARRIRDRRFARYLKLVASLAIAAAYILIEALSFAEAFHFVEYGLLAWLFYGAMRTRDDGSLIVLPLLAGVLVGTLDGIVKLRPTVVFDAQHGGFTAGSSPVSWGSINELLVNLTKPSFGLAQREMVEEPQGQGGLDGEIRVAPLPAPPATPAGRPGSDRFRGPPHRHIAASNEGLIVGRPVRHPMLRLIPGMNLRLHPRSVAPAEGPEKCGPRRPTRSGYSCNNAEDSGQ